MKYLVHEVRSQITRSIIMRFRAPEKVKEQQPDGHYKWIPGFKSVDGNTIELFGRKIVFKELIFCGISADDSMFWRDEHRTIVLDLTKGGTADGSERRGTLEGVGAENRNAQETSGHKKGKRRIKNLAQKEITR